MINLNESLVNLSDLGVREDVTEGSPGVAFNESLGVTPSEVSLGSSFRDSQHTYPKSSETLDVPEGTLVTSNLIGAPLKHRGASSSPEVDKQRAKKRNKTSDTQVAKSTALDAYTYYKGSVYPTDEIELAMFDLRADLVPLKEALQDFLIKNHKYLSVSEMSQLLGVTPKTVLKVLPSKYHDTINTFRTQTVIIWSKPQE